MKEPLRAALAAAQGRLRSALSHVRAHRFWVECACVTIFGVLAAFSVGHAAVGRTRALEARAAGLERAENVLARWRADLQRPAPPEGLAWRDSEATLRSLGGDAARALSVARLVAERADEVGITGLRVALLASDSLVEIEGVDIGAWAVDPSGEGLSVEFEGDVGDVVGLLGALPPQAALVKVDMADRGDARRVRIVLVTRRVSPAS